MHVLKALYFVFIVIPRARLLLLLTISLGPVHTVGLISYSFSMCLIVNTKSIFVIDLSVVPSISI